MNNIPYMQYIVHVAVMRLLRNIFNLMLQDDIDDIFHMVIFMLSITKMWYYLRWDQQQILNKSRVCAMQFEMEKSFTIFKCMYNWIYQTMEEEINQMFYNNFNYKS